LKSKLLHIGLLISFQFCLLEWPNHSKFIFEITIDVFKQKQLVNTLTHPIILISLITQLIIIASFFFKVNKKLISICIGLLSIIVLLFLIIGIISKNSLMLLYTFPYILLLILIIKNCLNNKIEAV
jgi:hypothetical protein